MSAEAESLFRETLSSLNRIHEILNDPNSDDYFSPAQIEAEITKSLTAGQTFLDSLLPRLPAHVSTT